MRRLAMLLGVTVILVACGGTADGPTMPVAQSVTPSAEQAGAGEFVASARPLEFTSEQVLVGPDPCSGVEHALTITWICRQQQQANGAEVLNCRREIVTDPTGYVGHGTITQVVNAQILNLRFRDILKNDAGDRMQGRSHGLLDLSTGTWRIYEFEAVCLSR